MRYLNMNESDENPAPNFSLIKLFEVKDKEKRESTNNTVVTSVRLSTPFHDLAKDNNVSLSEALRIGISVILADRGITPYNSSDLNKDRLNALTTIFQEFMQFEIKVFNTALEQNSQLYKQYTEYKNFGKFMHHVDELHKLTTKLIEIHDDN